MEESDYGDDWDSFEEGMYEVYAFSPPYEEKDEPLPVAPLRVVRKTVDGQITEQHIQTPFTDGEKQMILNELPSLKRQDDNGPFWDKLDELREVNDVWMLLVIMMMGVTHLKELLFMSLSVFTDDCN
ncbi:hypothetical protein scyTo_0016883 [Scyliorhinus torazame]|uniref:Uncharacterized protein n=1 Tax=Scyliorhinus torazame TaxID=75743 RepID=A0A401Q0C8_SCYTO|nr:hypothetical protein [Scyliorhinus torazame]